jgi:hypothetical protein
MAKMAIHPAAFGVRVNDYSYDNIDTVMVSLH